MIVLAAAVGFPRLDSSHFARTYSDDHRLGPRSMIIFDGLRFCAGTFGTVALLLLLTTFVFAPAARRFADGFAASPHRVSWTLALGYGAVFLALTAVSILSVLH